MTKASMYKIRVYLRSFKFQSTLGLDESTACVICQHGVTLSQNSNPPNLAEVGGFFWRLSHICRRSNTVPPVAGGQRHQEAWPWALF